MPDATALAQTLVAALLAGGVREVVLAPGSRSAPLALVLWAAARWVAVWAGKVPVRKP